MSPVLGRRVKSGTEAGPPTGRLHPGNGIILAPMTAPAGTRQQKPKLDLLRMPLQFQEPLQLGPRIAPVASQPQQKNGRDGADFFQAEDGIRGYKVTGVQTC